MSHAIPHQAQSPGVLRKLVPVLLFACFGLGIGFVMGRWLSVVEGPKTSPSVLIGALLVWGVGAIVWHECGHVVGGWLAGFRFMLLAVGPMRIARETGGIRIGLNRALQFAGGVALMLPRAGTPSPRQLTYYIAGGPAASALGALGLLVVAMLMPAESVDARVVLLIGAMFNASIMIATIVPWNNGPFLTDGGQLLDLRRGGYRGELRVALRALVAASMLGTRPREWNVGQVERALALADVARPLDGAMARLLGLYHMLDVGDHGRTRSLIRELQRHPAANDPYLRTVLRLDAAFVAAWVDGDAATARAAFDDAGNGHTERHHRLRVEAAVLRAEGDPAGAAARAREALTLLPRSLDRGAAVAERDWLEQIVMEGTSPEVRS